MKFWIKVYDEVRRRGISKRDYGKVRAIAHTIYAGNTNTKETA